MLGSRGRIAASNRPLSSGGRCGQRRHRKAAKTVSGRNVACGAFNNKRLQIVFVSTEVAPWSKTGGLGDVVASLPAALAARGHKVMTVSPRYAAYPGVFDTGLLAPIEASDGRSAAAAGQTAPSGVGGSQPRLTAATEVSYARYYACNDRGVLRVFVDHPIFGAAGTAGIANCSTRSPHTKADAPVAHQRPASPPHAAAAAAADNSTGGSAHSSGPAARDPPSRGTSAPAAFNSSSCCCGPASAPPTQMGGGWRSGYAHSRPPRLDRVLAELEADGEAAAAASLSSSCGDPSVGVYTYGEGEALAQQVELQARNNVLCQAALAAPVLLWHDPTHIPAELRADLSKGASGAAGCCFPPEALPFVLHNGIAEPAIMLEPGATERLRAILDLNRRALHPSSPLSSSCRRGTTWHGSGASGARPWTAAAAEGGGRQAGGRGSGAVEAATQPQQHHQVMFVANDWPSALLPLWLQTYTEVMSSATSLRAALQARLRQLDAAFGPAMLAARPPREAAAATGAPVGDEAAPSLGAVSATTPAPSPLGGADDEAVAAALAARSAEATAARSAEATAASGSAAATVAAVEDSAVMAAASDGAPAGPPVQHRDASWQSVSFTAVPTSDVGHNQSAAAQRDASYFASSSSDGVGGGLQPDASPLTALATVTAVLEPPQPEAEAAAVQVQRKRSDLGMDGIANDTASSNSNSSNSSPGQRQCDRGGLQGSGGSAGGLPAPMAASQPLPPPGQAPAEAMALASSQAAAPVMTRAAATAGAKAASALAPAEAVGLVWEEQSRQEALLLQLVYTLNAIAMPGLDGSQPADPAGTEAGAGAVRPAAAPQAQDELTQSLATQQQAASAAAAAAADARGAVDDSEARMRRTLEVFRSFVGSRLQGSKVVLAVHNFAFQGLFSADTFWRLGLPLFALQQMLLGPGASAGADAAGGPAGPPAAGGGRDRTGEGGAADAEAADAEAARPPTAAATSATASSVQVRFVSWLKGALLSSDVLVTVSPGYARELTGAQPPPASPSPAPGFPAVGALELREVVSSRGIRAIMNGLDDESLWNPAADPLLRPDLRYSRASAAEGKARAKARLQAVLGLEPDPHAPLFGFVGRLDGQKGVDVVLAALPQLLGPPEGPGGGYNRSLGYDPVAASTAAEQARRGSAARWQARRPLQALLRRLQRISRLLPWRRQQPTEAATEPPARAGGAQALPTPALPRRRLQVAMLGAGKQWLQDGLAALPRAYPGRAAGVVGFDEPLCHLMMAGCDYLLVPSRWEPCGLVALAAQRYGAVPVVAPTGGLLDALLAPTADGRADEFTGLLMDEVVGPEDDPMAARRAAASLARAVGAACDMYGTRSYTELREKCMARDVSWAAPARQWEELLLEVAGGGGDDDDDDEDGAAAATGGGSSAAATGEQAVVRVREGLDATGAQGGR